MFLKNPVVILTMVNIGVNDSCSARSIICERANSIIRSSRTYRSLLVHQDAAFSWTKTGFSRASSLLAFEACARIFVCCTILPIFSLLTLSLLIHRIYSIQKGLKSNEELFKILLKYWKKYGMLKRNKFSPSSLMNSMLIIRFCVLPLYPDIYLKLRVNIVLNILHHQI